MIIASRTVKAYSTRQDSRSEIQGLGYLKLTGGLRGGGHPIIEGALTGGPGRLAFFRSSGLRRPHISCTDHLDSQRMLSAHGHLLMCHRRVCHHHQFRQATTNVMISNHHPHCMSNQGDHLLRIDCV